MIEAHQGNVQILHSFEVAWSFLEKIGSVNLHTEVGTQFRADSKIARDGRYVIRFFQKQKEYGRAYPCCWGHYYNCNRTRIGMYTKAIDAFIK